MRSINKIAALLLVPAVLLLSPLLTILQPASAISGSEFNPGRIIDDIVFTNSGAMSVSDIQNFLNAKVPNCDTNGSASKSYYYNSSTGAIGNSSDSWVTTTRAVYGQRYNSANGTNKAAAPYVCLKNYVENPSTQQNNLQNPNASISGGQSAAQIIYNAGQSFGINPQVLLTTLQKEQGLVTDDWPWTNEYQIAMGYACPDSGSCNTAYYGFANQVTNAAKQFRRYITNPNNYNYVVGNNYIQYNPSASCGGSTVNIQNQATASLYNYTPYQPNAGALASVSDSTAGGTSPCGAYGNRNFWWYFNQWFGSSLAAQFSAQYRYQSPYPVVPAGSSVDITMQFTNVGNQFWKDDSSNFPGYWPIHLATGNPVNRISSFAAPSWLSANRPSGRLTAVLNADGSTNAAATSQHTVQPGQIGQFEFTLHIPLNQTPGVYREYFQPIVEGSKNWAIDGETYLNIGVTQSNNQASYYGQSAYPTLPAGGGATAAFLKFSNSGNTIWYDDSSAPSGQLPVHLATSWPINRGSTFASGWPSASRPNTSFSKVYESNGTTLAPNQHLVYPGQIAEFDFNMQAPAGTAPGTYKEYFQPIVEGAPNNMYDLRGTAWLGVTVP